MIGRKNSIRRLKAYLVQDQYLTENMNGRKLAQEISPEVEHMTSRLKRTLSVRIRDEPRPNPDAGKLGETSLSVPREDPAGQQVIDQDRRGPSDLSATALGEDAAFRLCRELGAGTSVVPPRALTPVHRVTCSWRGWEPR